MKKTENKKFKIVQWINMLDSHHRLYIALFSSLLTFLIFKETSFSIHLMITWLSYIMVSLLFSWITILTSHPIEVQKMAHNQDSSRTLVFIFVVAAALVSLFAVVILLQTKGDLSKQELTLHIIISMTVVLSSWWLVHTVFTLRYAHFYYSDVSLDKGAKHEKPGGLDFPSEPNQDYLDFTYFAFVIGTTFQVSDVQITSRRIRRLVWMHGIISFAFNTVIVALIINIISGLIKQ